MATNGHELIDLTLLEPLDNVKNTIIVKPASTVARNGHGLRITIKINKLNYTITANNVTFRS